MQTQRDVDIRSADLVEQDFGWAKRMSDDLLHVLARHATIGSVAPGAVAGILPAQDRVDRDDTGSADLDRAAG